MRKLSLCVQVWKGWSEDQALDHLAWSAVMEPFADGNTRSSIMRHVAFETLPEALLYLRASLGGAILEMQRACSQPTAGSLLLPEELSVQDQTNSSELWEIVQTILPNEREQRLAYLLFHCGLSPREIVQCRQEEWNDVEEISR